MKGLPAGRGYGYGLCVNVSRTNVGDVNRVDEGAFGDDYSLERLVLFGV